jgi:hypothetical protein
MSRLARFALASSVVFAVSIISYVHYQQKEEKNVICGIFKLSLNDNIKNSITLVLLP